MAYASSDSAVKQAASVQRNLVSVPHRFSFARTPYSFIDGSAQRFNVFHRRLTTVNSIERNSFEFRLNIDDDDRAR